MKALVSLLQFTTILPLGKPQDLENFARHSYIYPCAGYIIGAIIALPVFFIADRIIASAVTIAALLLITGVHHFDGLLDLGDGLMAHGDQEKRIRALTDRQVGAGGVATGIAVTLLLFAGLMVSSSIIVAVIIGEVCAKFSMVFLTAYGTPFRDGIHSYLHNFSKPFFPFIAALFCIPLVFLPGFSCSGNRSVAGHGCMSCSSPDYFSKIIRWYQWRCRRCFKRADPCMCYSGGCSYLTFR